MDNKSGIMDVIQQITGDKGANAKPLSFKAKSKTGDSLDITVQPDGKTATIKTEASIKIVIPSKISHEKILSVAAFVRRLADLNPPSNKINQDMLYNKLLGILQSLDDIFKDAGSSEEKEKLYRECLLSAIVNVSSGDFEAVKKKLEQCAENLSQVILAKVMKENIDVRQMAMDRFSEIEVVTEICKKARKSGKTLSKKSLKAIEESCESITNYDIVCILENIAPDIEGAFIKENNDKFLKDL